MSENKMDLMSSDMKRELERQQWEKEAQMELEGPSGPVHYSNVQFNGRWSASILTFLHYKWTISKTCTTWYVL